MALIRFPACHKLVCDVCSLDFESGEGWVPHFPDDEEAKTWSEESSWVWYEGHVWCGNCSPDCGECSHSWVCHDLDGGECEGGGDGCEKNCLKFKWKVLELKGGN